MKHPRADLYVRLLSRANADDEEVEERLCYRHGRMVDDLYRWLLEENGGGA